MAGIVGRRVPAPSRAAAGFDPFCRQLLPPERDPRVSFYGGIPILQGVQGEELGSYTNGRKFQLFTLSLSKGESATMKGTLRQAQGETKIGGRVETFCR